MKLTRVKKWLAVGLAALMLVAFSGLDNLVDAKGGRSGGSFGGSRSSSSRSSWGSSRSSSRPSTSRSSSSKPSGLGSSRSAKTTPTRKITPKSAAQQKAYDTAKKNGTVFSSRKDAAAAFKAKNADKYKSTYATKPATRPSHIPQTTKTPDGKTVNITYNQAGGGYGYTNSLGAFIMYDAMSDAIMMNTLMAQNNYAYGPRPVAQYHSVPGTTVVHTGPNYFLWTFIGLCFIVVVCIVVSSSRL